MHTLFLKLASIFIFSCLAITVNAQQAPALTELQGTVMDQAGAAIPSVRIVLSDNKGKIYESTSNDDGAYSLRIPAGSYRIEAKYIKHVAWEPFKIARYEVASTNAMELDICLRVSQKFIDTNGTPVTTKQ